MTQQREVPVADTPMLIRLSETGREGIAFVLDGNVVHALKGDTVLTAILLHQSSLRLTDLSGERRAGFCLMGACQDCWVTLETGERLRACSTFVTAGMRVLTRQDAL